MAAMAGVMLGLGRFGSRLCHQSTCRDVGDVVVPWPSPVISPSARNRRSARVVAVVSAGGRG